MLPMPNRYNEVNLLCHAHPEAFPLGEGNDAARLAFLQGTIIPTLNTTDDGNWGYMTKTDQGNKTPCDILMWRPTNGVVDCMTGTGACWLVHGAPPPAWVWTPVTSPEPEPGPPATIPYDESKSIEFGLACNDVYAESGAPIDPGMISVHSQRCAYDYYVEGMDWEDCLTKHTNEFRAVYGLPPL